jgi:phage gpG-like protein
MSDFNFSVSSRPAGFKSVVLTEALKNFGKLPKLMIELGQVVTQNIKDNASGKILNIRTGRLWHSWGWQVGATNAGWQTIVGSDCVYSRIHNYGGWTGKNHKTHLPARHYVDLALTKSHVKINQLFKNFVANMWRQHG